MEKFMDYNPDQAYLLPPSVRDVLSSGHLCFFVRSVVAKLNLALSETNAEPKAGPRARRRCWFRFGCTPSSLLKNPFSLQL